MEFIDIKDNATESLLGVEVNMSPNGCGIRWNYPIKYAEVCIFEVPLSDKFDEQRAISGEYKQYNIKYPNQQFNSKSFMNFAIFPINNEGQAVRQSKSLWNCNIVINYGITTQEEEIYPKGKRKLFSRPTIKVHTFLTIKSPISLPGKHILYRLKSTDGVFCLPSDIVAGRIHQFEIHDTISLFTNEIYITLEDTSH